MSLLQIALSPSEVLTFTPKRGQETKTVALLILYSTLDFLAGLENNQFVQHSSDFQSKDYSTQLVLCSSQPANAGGRAD